MLETALRKWLNSPENLTRQGYFRGFSTSVATLFRYSYKESELILTGSARLFVKMYSQRKY